MSSIYIKDAIGLLLKLKDENIRLNPIKFFSKYFLSVKTGSHVLLREYSYISINLYNRKSFIKVFYQSFLNIWKSAEELGIQDYHSLALLICNDFPIDIFTNTFKLLGKGEKKGQIAFIQFIYALQIQFCFNEFLDKSKLIYNELDLRRVEAFESTEKKDVEEREEEGVESKLFLEALLQLQNNHSSIDIPPVDVIQTILSSNSITYSDFLLELVNHEKLNASIGSLPSRYNLLKISEREAYLYNSTIENLEDLELTNQLLQPNLYIFKNDTDLNVIANDIYED